MEKAEMEQLYGAIFRRRSIRQYDGAPLGADFLDETLRQCTRTQELFAAEPVAFKILSSGMVGGMMGAKSPQFLAVYAHHTEAGVANAAFRLQQMDLWFSRQDIGSCWLGMTRPKKEGKDSSGLPFVILLAFGRAAVPVHRESAAEFNRKPLSEITATPGATELLEPLRLAPSATNRQPWFAETAPGALRLYMKQGNILEKAMLGNMPLVDEGIALCHLWLACGHADRFASFERENAPANTPAGFSYALTLRLTE